MLARPGFFDAYVARVHGIIQDNISPGGVFRAAKIRNAQGCPGSDRSNNQFLGKALRHLVKAGVLARIGRKYQRKGCART